MSDTRLQIAKTDIFRFFDSLPKRIFRLSDLERFLREQRGFWRLTQNTTAQTFIDFLARAGRLSKVVFPFPAPYKKEIRYVWGHASIYQVMLSINPAAYFSHYTAVRFHGLTEQWPKTTYLSVELPKITPQVGGLSQSAIDKAFSRKQRTTQNIAETPDFRVCVLSAKNTGRVGVVEETFMPEHGAVRVTNLERTLIDIAVRPAYGGGVFEVRKAYELAKDRLSANRLSALLQKLGYAYPYHQVIGFYLEQAGCPASQLELLRRFPMNFDFYLAHDMGPVDYVKEWRLFVPKGF